MNRVSGVSKLLASWRCVISLFVGAVLVFAGATKLADPASFLPALRETIAVTSLDVARVLAVAEAGLGAWVLLCAGSRKPLAAAMIVFGVFVAVHATLAYFGSTVDCGCLGQSISNRMSHEAWAATNGVVAIVCLIGASSARVVQSKESACP